MGNGLKLGTREKVVQKMSREGAIEQSLSEGMTRRVSKRIADADFSHPKEEMLQDEGRDPSLRKSRMKKRYGRELREDLNKSRQNPESAKFHESDSGFETDTSTGDFTGSSDAPGTGYVYESSGTGQTGAGNTSESSGSGKERLRTKKGKRLKEKSESANERLSHAQRKQKTKKRLKKERVYDEAKGKAKTRLHFEDEVVPKSEGAGVIQRAGYTGKSAVSKATMTAEGVAHGKIYEVENENVGVKAAHQSEIAGEAAARSSVKSAVRKLRHSGGRQHRRLSKLEHQAERANTKLLFEQSLSENPEIGKSFIKKQQQKRVIKQRYAAAYKATRNGAEAVKATSTAAAPTRSIASRIGNGVKNFAKRHPAGIATAAFVGVILVMFLSGLGTFGSMISQAGGAVVESTYLSSDDDIHAAEDHYAGLEAALQRQIDQIESTYPGYDEYRYQVDEITHNPYQLISYLTAKYGNFKARNVYSELGEIFREQYSMSVYGETVTETVTKTVRVGESLGNVVTSGYCNCVICCGRWSGGPTASGVYPTSEHTLAVDASDPFVPIGTHIVMNGTEYVVEDTGNFARYGVQFDVYYDSHFSAQMHGHRTWEAYLADSNGPNEVEITTTETIRRLNVTMTGHDLDTILRSRLTEEEERRYNIYNATYGNRDYLFPVNTLPIQGGGMSYDIPPEALSDGRFRNMITEAEKYLGYPYVWGGASPSTSFDCSGFVSWVINHSGNGWDYGRLTAEGLRGVCTYVSPSQAKPGDLIFFQGTYNTAGASHVGIYVGDGMMIHCGNPIQYASVETNYWQGHFMCYGRLP